MPRLLPQPARIGRRWLKTRPLSRTARAYWTTVSRVVTCRMAAHPFCGYLPLRGRRIEARDAGAGWGVAPGGAPAVSRALRGGPRRARSAAPWRGSGGEINAATEQELTVYWCKAARPYMEECLDLLVDMAMGSVFDPEELERERMVVLEEQNQINDYPNDKGRGDAGRSALAGPPPGSGRERDAGVDLRHEPRGGGGALPRRVLA